MSGLEGPSRLKGKSIPSRLVGKSKEELLKKRESEELPSRLLVSSKRIKDESEPEISSPLESAETKFKRGTVLIHCQREKDEPSMSEFVIDEIITETSGRKLYRLKGPKPHDQINKTETTLLNDIEEGKYRFKLTDIP